MRVILLQDVAKIGRRGDVIEVPDGYALNQLVPKKLAQPATAANLKRVEKLHAVAAEGAEVEKASFAAAKASLTAHTPTVAAEANEKGHLFKAVSVEEIIAAAKTNGISLSAQMISIPKPIKELGTHTFELKHAGEKHSCSVEVTKS